MKTRRWHLDVGTKEELREYLEELFGDIANIVEDGERLYLYATSPRNGRILKERQRAIAEGYYDLPKQSPLNKEAQKIVNST